MAPTAAITLDACSRFFAPGVLVRLLGLPLLLLSRP